MCYVTVKTPLCESCRSTSGLCSGCQRRLDKGEITLADVDVSRLLAQNKEKLSLEAVEVTRAFDCGNMIFLFTRSPPGHLIGRDGRTANYLKKELGKHVRVIQLAADKFKLVEEVIHPVKPLGINTVFRDGAQVEKIRISEDDSRKLPTAPDRLTDLFTRVLEAPAVLVEE